MAERSVLPIDEPLVARLVDGQAIKLIGGGGVGGIVARYATVYLAHLARHANVASVLAEARGRRPPCIRPEPFEQDGERVICYPGDPLHSVAELALPGPTRLHWRNRRFEPEGGLAALLGA